MQSSVQSMESSKYFWAKKYPIAYYEADFKMVLKPSALLNLLQDVATINAEMLGFGYTFTSSKNFGWFLIKYHMEFDEYPQAVDEVLIKTEARGLSKILANRDFEIWTSDNKKRLGRVVSNWMLIDLSTKNILPLSRIIDFMPKFEKRENDLSFSKVIPPQRVDFSKVFEIRYDDIDVNRHVNNANYIIWAFEALPHDFRVQFKLKTLDVVYKKEISFGATVISELQLDKEEKISSHVVKDNSSGEELCIIKAQWI